MPDDFETFVINYLGPAALAGEKMSLADVARLAFTQGKLAGAKVMQRKAAGICYSTAYTGEAGLCAESILNLNPEELSK